jgi:hypothetical protein
VTKFDSLTTGLSDMSNTTTTPSRVSKPSSAARLPPIVESPLRMELGGGGGGLGLGLGGLGGLRAEPSLLEEKWDGAGMGLDDESFDAERGAIVASSPPKRAQILGSKGGMREGKENLPG